MRDLIDALRYGTSTFHRLILALAATLYAFTTAIGSDMANQTSVQACRALVLSSGYKWAFVGIFAVDAAALWWRLFDSKPKILIAITINILTAALWVTVAAATVVVYRAFLPDSIGEVMMAVIAIFVMVRTDKTFADRRTA